LQLPSATVGIGQDQPSGSLSRLAGSYCPSGKPNDYAANAVDGDTCSFAATDFGLRRGNVPQWFELDLGREYSTLSSLRLFRRNDGPWARARTTA